MPLGSFPFKMKIPNDFLGKKLTKKGLKQKSEHHHQILSRGNSLGIKFQSKLTILNFWTILI